MNFYRIISQRVKCLKSFVEFHVFNLNMSDNSGDKIISWPLTVLVTDFVVRNNIKIIILAETFLKPHVNFQVLRHLETTLPLMEVVQQF